MECVCSPVIQNTGSVFTGQKIRIRQVSLVSLQISRDIAMDHHGSPWVTMGSCEIWDLRKLLFGVAQAHMKAKDWTWPKRLADSPHPSPYHLPEMSNQPVICRTPTRQLRRWIRPLDWLKQLVICRTFVGRVWLKWRVLLWNLKASENTGCFDRRLPDCSRTWLMRCCFDRGARCFCSWFRNCHWQSFENMDFNYCT